MYIGLLSHEVFDLFARLMMSYKEFEQCSLRFLNVSDALHDGWVWNELVREGVKMYGAFIVVSDIPLPTRFLAIIVCRSTGRDIW